MELKEFLEKQGSFQMQERKARQNYDNACTMEKIEHRQRMNKEMDNHHAVMAKLKDHYENQLEAISAERKAVRLEWAESEAKRRIEEQKEAMQ